MNGAFLTRRLKVLSSGVPQGSILLFLIFINDIVSDIGSNIRIFADDTSMYIVVENPNIAAATLQSDIDKVSNWADKWHVDFNPSKSECLLISRKTGVNPHPSLYMNGVQVSPASDHNHLGLLLSGYGTWQYVVCTKKRFRHNSR